MAGQRNVANDKRVKRGKKQHGTGSSNPMHRPGMKPHQQRLPSGPVADAPIDPIESGDQQH